jgi:adenine-specific DNA-methyltransferase
MEPLTHSTPDIAAANFEALAALLPGVVSETVDGEGNVTRAVDIDLLRQELNGHVVEGPQEAYHLDWPGKREALAYANRPTSNTLRPLRGDSVSFDTTKNLFIEGDNLEALKLLQEPYLGRVKLIYIDPPYNTGGDLVYRDNFASLKQQYQVNAAQVDNEGNRLLSNPDTDGRYHSNWLSMIYPRLKVASRLLREDGVIMVSIDDAEQASLRRIMDQVFGERNFIAQLVWEKGRKNDAKFFSTGHEYLLVYAKSQQHLRDLKTQWREEKPGARAIWEEYARLRRIHGSDDAVIEQAIAGWFSSLPKADPSKKWARYRRIDANGPWRDRDISWPGGDGPVYDVIHPVTGEPVKVPEGGWRYSNPAEMRRQIELGLVEFRKDHTEPPFRKAHLRPIAEEFDGLDDDTDDTFSDDAELATQVRGSCFYKQSQVAVKHLRSLMGAKVFNNPKDHFELARLFEYVLNGSDGIVMDFFAGSGTTAEAVFEVCSRTGLNCPVVLVQLPEDLDENAETATGTSKAMVKNAIKYLDERGRPHSLAELTKIRMELAGMRVLSARRENDWSGDVGFRAFRVDSTNYADLGGTPDSFSQDSLAGTVDRIKPDRTGEDLLFQVILDWGMDLSAPIVRERIEGCEVFSVDDGGLVACFADEVSVPIVEAIASRRPTYAVFNDHAFSSDSARINADQIFRQLSPDTESLKVI